MVITSILRNTEIIVEILEKCRMMALATKDAKNKNPFSASGVLTEKG
jgi:hypothetical protein